MGFDFSPIVTIWMETLEWSLSGMDKFRMSSHLLTCDGFKSTGWEVTKEFFGTVPAMTTDVTSGVGPNSGPIWTMWTSVLFFLRMDSLMYFKGTDRG